MQEPVTGQVADRAWPMPTRIRVVDPEHIDPAAIAEAAALIRTGQLVAFPTETVYGLGASAFDAQAVGRIFAAKARPANDPLIVHIGLREQLAAVTSHFPERAAALIDAFWPGPLTLVLPRGAQIPPNLSAGLPTVAVRMPAHPVALALIAASGVPIAAPSANLFAHTSPTTAQHVLDDLGGRIPLILDGGPTPIGVESSILDLSSERPRLLRPGGIPLEDIARFVPGVELASRPVPSTASDTTAAMPAPGLFPRHYSPHAELRLYEGADDAVRRALAETAAALIEAGQAVGLLLADDDRAALAAFIAAQPVQVVTLGALGDPAQVARNLFAGLRDLDARGVHVILARLFPAAGLGLAVRDRLIRAAEGRVTQV